MASSPPSSPARKERKPVCKWTEKEDLLMTKLVQKYGTRHWTIIGTKLPGRNGKQCRERYANKTSERQYETIEALTNADERCF